MVSEPHSESCQTSNMALSSMYDKVWNKHLGLALKWFDKVQ